MASAMQERTGRVYIHPRRTVRLTVVVSEDEAVIIRDNARQDGAASVSDFGRRRLLMKETNQ
jgi:hypothetical protein